MIVVGGRTYYLDAMGRKVRMIAECTTTRSSSSRQTSSPRSTLTRIRVRSIDLASLASSLAHTTRIAWQGDFGINIHEGGYGTTSSLGCQTIPPDDQWATFIALAISEAKRIHGDA